MSKLSSIFHLLMVKKRSKIGRFLMGVVLLVGVFFIGINIFLNSDTIRGRIERKLAQKTGEAWDIEAIHYTWNGNIKLHSLQASLEEGEISVKRIIVVPDYWQLFQKNLTIKAITIEYPVCVLTESWLMKKIESSMSMADTKTPVKSPNRSLGTKVREPFIKLIEKVKRQDAKQAKQKSEKDKKPSTARKNGEPDRKNAPSPGEHIESPTEKWLYLIDANIHLKTKSGDVVSLKNVSANLPFGGKDLKGYLEWQEIQIFNQQVISKGSVEIQNNGHQFYLAETDIHLLGVKLEPKMYLARNRFQLLFHLDLKIPEQSQVELLKGLDQPLLDISADKLAGRIQVAGDLVSPLSWSSIAEIKALDVLAEEPYHGVLAEFDWFQLQLKLDQGVLKVPQVVMYGEELSLMSNGTLSMNGYGYGVARVIASEEKALRIDSIQKGGSLVDGVQTPIMLPFDDTHDRYAMDIRYDGALVNPSIKVENISSWQPLFPTLKKLFQFVRKERRGVPINR